MISKQELKEKFKTGAIPTGEDFAQFIDAFVASIDGKEPDTTGDVGTSFKVIDSVRLNTPWTEYPNGVSEFYCNYKSSDYEDCINEFPCFGLLKDGNIAVRTYVDHDNEVAYQQIDNIKDGIFKAGFVRIGNNNGTWEKLYTAYKPVSAMESVVLYTKGGMLVSGEVSFDNGYTYAINVVELSD